MSRPTALEVREAIQDALPQYTSLDGGTPRRKHVYVPLSHVRALRLDSTLVLGGRGVGKSFWSAALRDPSVRAMLGQDVPQLAANDVASGFGEKTNIDDYPGPDTFKQLLETGAAPYDVWRAVAARWIGRLAPTNPTAKHTSWPQTVEWVKNDPESFERLAQTTNEQLEKQKSHALIVFDALDRVSTSWETMDAVVRDLLRVGLWFRPFRSLHTKIFLREDQYDGRPVANFADASKLLSGRVELMWSRGDLHGLLWQYLANADGRSGEVLRDLARIVVREAASAPFEIKDDAYAVPAVAKRDGPFQHRLFERLAGDKMGRDKRRGIPYSWAVGHLADSRGRTSPRSFLAGLREAAADSAARYPDHPTPLHYESIKRGIQAASEIRVNEMAEDYPWVKVILAPLTGQTVPIEASSIFDEWRRKIDSPDRLVVDGQLAPEHIQSGWDGIMLDLQTLGILEKTRDGRWNMPDLYRVGFRLGRRGGVKPVASNSSL